MNTNIFIKEWSRDNDGIIYLTTTDGDVLTNYVAPEPPEPVIGLFCWSQEDDENMPADYFTFSATPEVDDIIICNDSGDIIADATYTVASVAEGFASITVNDVVYTRNDTKDILKDGE